MITMPSTSARGEHHALLICITYAVHCSSYIVMHIHNHSAYIVYTYRPCIYIYICMYTYHISCVCISSIYHMCICNVKSCDTTYNASLCLFRDHTWLVLSSSWHCQRQLQQPQHREGRGELRWLVWWLELCVYIIRCIYISTSKSLMIYIYIQIPYD